MSQPPEDEPIRIALLEDHAILRESLAGLLLLERLEVVGAFSTAESFLAAVDVIQPDVAIVDLALDSGAAPSALSGLQVLLELRKRAHAPRVVVLSASQDPAQVALAYRRGAHAYLYKADANAAQLVAVVRSVHRGERLGHPRSLELALHSPPPPAVERSPALAHVTAREQEVLSWIGTGADNLKIAAQLGISERTVGAHITALYRKLSVENRIELALLARDLGLSTR
jgi:two-component system nitrate/nitrite response regulator NarL